MCNHYQGNDLGSVCENRDVIDLYYKKESQDVELQASNGVAAKRSYRQDKTLEVAWQGIDHKH